MIIGVDADGVLTDMQKFNYKYGKKFFGKKIVNPNGYNVSEIFDVSKIKEFFYGVQYFPMYCKKCPPRENASNVLNKLLMEGHELHEITARRFVTSKSILGKYSKKWFVQWCKDSDFSFSSVTFCSEKKGAIEKYEACTRLNVSVMIDDRPEIVLYLAERGIQVLMMDAPYNQAVQHKNVERVYDWCDIYDKISEICNNTKGQQNFNQTIL